jgi:hypothetical protein
MQELKSIIGELTLELKKQKTNCIKKEKNGGNNRKEQISIRKNKTSKTSTFFLGIQKDIGISKIQRGF